MRPGRPPPGHGTASRTRSVNDGSSQASLTLVSCGAVANPTRVAASDAAQIQTDDRIHIRVHPLAAADTVTRPTVAQKPEALIEKSRTVGGHGSPILARTHRSTEESLHGPDVTSCARLSLRRHEALELLIEVLDDDEGDGRGGLLRAAALFDQQEPLAVG